MRKTNIFVHFGSGMDLWEVKDNQSGIRAASLLFPPHLFIGAPFVFSFCVMAEFYDNGPEEVNDIAAVLSCPGDLVMKVLMGRLSILETQLLINHVGKVEINIGEGLTLLHQAASTNRADLIHFLCAKGHSTEVNTCTSSFYTHYHSDVGM